jgi:hypothetical protein
MQDHMSLSMKTTNCKASTALTPPSWAEPHSRAALRLSKRVVIKAGTSVIANDEGSPSLTRLGAIVEQIAELNHAGVEVCCVLLQNKDT